jgi:DNA helicase-2/ATP-dependent DNA helicase PcrA
MNESKDLLAGLNPPQRQAVEAIDGPVLVLAGPGSGKTRVLTHRVAHLVGRVGVPPWHLLAVTFTNKAAREMSERLVDLIGEDALGQLTIGTFHAICARILRRESEALNFDQRFVIFDTDDQLRVVKAVLGEMNLDDKLYRPRAVLGAISKAKNELIRPEEYSGQTYWHEVAGRIYGRYQKMLRENNALDFDDLLLETAVLMRDNKAVQARYRDRYGFLMVDEFQDTNTAQYALLKALAAVEDLDAAHNFFAVGDEDQSIYRWRGADYRNLDRFRRDFPGGQVILLEQNYRSTQVILDAAQAVIGQNANRTRKELWTEAGAGELITRFEAYDENEEAAYIVREIEAAVASGRGYRDCAVMYRTNAQSRAIEDALVRRGIPYQLVGGTRFYDRREVRDVLAYLRVLQNPRDEIALSRIVNVPPRGIGPKAWKCMGDWAAALGSGRWEALSLIARGEDESLASERLPAADTRTRNALGRYHAAMAGLMEARESLPVPELLDRLLQESGYAAWLRDGSDEGEERWENVQELRGVAQDFALLPPAEGLSSMLESVALASDVDQMDEAGPDRVTLLTLHAAKGLEYPVVFIPGIEERILPHSRSIDDPEGLAEERRLFYVGLTRAERKLYLIHAFRRTIFGSSEPAEPSRFLADLPPECLEQGPRVSRSGHPVSPGARARATSWSTPQVGAKWSENGGRAAGVRRTQSSAERWAASQRARGPSEEDREEQREAQRAAQRAIEARGAPASGARARGSQGKAAAAPSPSASANDPRFKAGDKVKHGHFGPGIVVTSQERDGDEEVTVAFGAGVGVKKLMQSFAKLVKA